MSWFKDPELFIDCVTGVTRLWRLRKNFGSPITKNDFTFEKNVANHLSLIDNSFSWNKNDFDALAAFLYRHYIAVNCQGMVLTISFPRERSHSTYPDRSRIIYFLSHDVVNLPRYGLPVPLVPFRVVRYLEGGCAPVESSLKENELAAKLVACISERDGDKAEKQALEKRVFGLVAENASLQDDLKREKDDKNALVNDLDREKAKNQDLAKRVSDAEAKNYVLKDEIERDKDQRSTITNDLDGNMAEKQTLTNKVSDLEATIFLCHQELQRWKDDNNALINDLEREKAEKQSLEKRFSRYEEEISTLKDEVRREKDYRTSLEEIPAAFEADVAKLKDKNMKLTEDISIWIHEVSDLQEQLNREKKDKQALEKKVFDLSSKHEEYCTCGAEVGLADKEPWMSGYTVPSNWVPFDELVQTFSRNTPLTITKVSNAPEFGEDNTTNVQSNYFYRGMLNGELLYPIVIVNIEELIPNKEKSRFDPNVWGLFNNAGTCYAARKPFESET